MKQEQQADTLQFIYDRLRYQVCELAEIISDLRGECVKADSNPKCLHLEGLRPDAAGILSCALCGFVSETLHCTAAEPTASEPVA